VSSISAGSLATLVGSIDGAGPAYRELADRIRLLVLDGRLAHQTRLPSERVLAEAMGVSRTTTTRVYAELRDQGLIESHRGSGSLVRVPSSVSSRTALIPRDHDGDTIALTHAAATAPAGVGRAFEAALHELPGLLATTGYLPDGLPVLRQRLASLYTARGLPTDAEQILVTSGAMGGIALVAKSLLRRGDRVLVESPAYPHAVDAFRAFGGRPVPLPAGPTPWDAGAMRSSLRRTPARLAYLVPDFHNPTGHVMDDATRREVAKVLREADVVPLVDETMVGLNLDGILMPRPFAAHHPRAITVGSAAKTFWGGLRLGWLRVPRDMVMPLIHERMALDLGSSAFEQLVMVHLLSDDTVRDATVARHREQRDTLAAALARELPDLAFTLPKGGMSLWVDLGDRVSSALTMRAAQHRLLLTPGPRFFAGPGSVGERFVRLPFTQAPEVLEDAVRRLGRAWRHESATQEGSDTPELDLIA